MVNCTCVSLFRTSQTLCPVLNRLFASYFIYIHHSLFNVRMGPIPTFISCLLFSCQECYRSMKSIWSFVNFMVYHCVKKKVVIDYSCTVYNRIKFQITDLIGDISANHDDAISFRLMAVLWALLLLQIGSLSWCYSYSKSLGYRLLLLRK